MTKTITLVYTGIDNEKTALAYEFDDDQWEMITLNGKQDELINQLFKHVLDKVLGIGLDEDGNPRATRHV